ncbi:MAG: hypothetical protein AABY22_01885 [Nanoarchaeota archaeon]
MKTYFICKYCKYHNELQLEEIPKHHSLFKEFCNSCSNENGLIFSHILVDKSNETKIFLKECVRISQEEIDSLLCTTREDATKHKEERKAEQTYKLDFNSNLNVNAIIDLLQFIGRISFVKEDIETLPENLQKYFKSIKNE